MTDIEKAELTLGNLENIRKHLIQEQAELANERGRVALGAHTGDKKSRSRLDEINVAAAKFASEFTSIEAAIIEANKNLDAAQAAEAQAADRTKAERIAALNAKLKEELDDADDALADAISSVLSARALLMEMHALGVTSPTDQMFRINSVAVIKTVIQLLPQPWINDFEFARLSPLQKKNFKDLANAWGMTIENQIVARLPKEEAA
ncbi:hypothetical protein [Bradyrhizobium diazoefficiens]